MWKEVKGDLKYFENDPNRIQRINQHLRNDHKKRRFANDTFRAHSEIKQLSTNCYKL